MSKYGKFEMTDRLVMLKEQAIERSTEPPVCKRASNQSHAFFELFNDMPLHMRQAKSFAYAIENEPIYVFPDERIHGIFYGGNDPQWYSDDKEWEEYSAVLRAAKRVAEEIPQAAAVETSIPWGEPAPGESTFIVSEAAIPGHIAWNYDSILKYGVEGLLAWHEEKLSAASDPQAIAYYEGVIICLKSILEWNRKHIQALQELLETVESDTLRAKIENSIAIMQRVPEKTARTFHEALQSFYFQWLCVIYEAPCGGNSPGRLDYILWPYLKKEFESGVLSYQDAGELLAELFIKLDERIHFDDGNVNTVVIGGIAPDGSDAVTPLTYLMLDVAESLDLTHPAIYTRLSEVNPPEYLDRCISYMLNGANRAQIVADEPIIKAMMLNDRMTFEDASKYICGGCMEICPQGMNSDLLYSFIFNVPKVVELLVTGGQCLVNGQQRLDMKYSLSDFDTFDDFYSAFEDHLRHLMLLKFRVLDIFSEEIARCRPLYLQSSMIDDCLERGRNQHDGGARYPDYGGTPMGIQNAADYLNAIKIAVYDDGFCSAGELVDALKANFKGYEQLHMRLKDIPKYGAGNVHADQMMNRVLRSVCEIMDSFETKHGGKVKPVILTFVWAPVMGHHIGASADGRYAGEPIGHGLTPQKMGFMNGITAAINSYCSLDNLLVSGGASTMWDMDASWIKHGILKAIVQTFTINGGQIFQGNMTSVAELEQAMKTPEKYPNLIVRVGGFSARFVNLPENLQQEIATRYRHSSDSVAKIIWD